MGTVIGVVVGYVLGTRAGDEGWTELRDAWNVISSSEEVRDLLSGGLALARDLVARGGGALSDALGGMERRPGLRPVA